MQIENWLKVIGGCALAALAFQVLMVAIVCFQARRPKPPAKA